MRFSVTFASKKKQGGGPSIPVTDQWGPERWHEDKTLTAKENTEKKVAVSAKHLPRMWTGVRNSRWVMSSGRSQGARAEGKESEAAKTTKKETFFSQFLP